MSKLDGKQLYPTLDRIDQGVTHFSEVPALHLQWCIERNLVRQDGTVVELTKDGAETLARWRRIYGGNQEPSVDNPDEC